MSSNKLDIYIDDKKYNILKQIGTINEENFNNYFDIFWAITDEKKVILIFDTIISKNKNGYKILEYLNIKFLDLNFNKIKKYIKDQEKKYKIKFKFNVITKKMESEITLEDIFEYSLLSIKIKEINILNKILNTKKIFENIKSQNVEIERGKNEI